MAYPLPKGLVKLTAGFTKNDPNDTTIMGINNDLHGGMKVVKDRAEMLAIHPNYLAKDYTACFVTDDDGAGAPAFYFLSAEPTNEDSTIQENWTSWKDAFGSDLPGGLYYNGLFDASTYTLTDADPDNFQGKFYIVEANATTVINDPNLFGGIETTVNNNDWIIFNSTLGRYEWFDQSKEFIITWSKLTGKPQVIKDLELGNLPSHNHSGDQVVVDKTVGGVNYNLLSELLAQILYTNQLAANLAGAADTDLLNYGQIKEYFNSQQQAGTSAAGIKTQYESNDDTNAYTDAEKAKVSNLPANTVQELASISQSKFKGHYTTIEDLQAAFPTGEPGDYADVDAGAGEKVIRHIWDEDDSIWRVGGGGSSKLAELEDVTLYRDPPPEEGQFVFPTVPAPSVVSFLSFENDTDFIHREIELSENDFNITSIIPAVAEGQEQTDPEKKIFSIKSDKWATKQYVDSTGSVFLKEEFVYTSSNTFTVSNTIEDIIYVARNGQLLSTQDYSIANQVEVTLNDVLNSDDEIDIAYLVKNQSMETLVIPGGSVSSGDIQLDKIAGRTYNETTPAIGDITIDTSGSVIGGVAVIEHNDSIEPTINIIPSDLPKNITGNYMVDALNEIRFLKKATKISINYAQPNVVGAGTVESNDTAPESLPVTSGLIYQADFMDPANYTLADTDKLESVSDQSPASNADTLKVSDGERPTLLTSGQAGTPCIQFNGAQIIKMPDIMTGEFTKIIFCNYFGQTDTNNARIVWGGDNGNDHSLGFDCKTGENWTFGNIFTNTKYDLAAPQNKLSLFSALTETRSGTEGAIYMGDIEFDRDAQTPNTDTASYIGGRFSGNNDMTGEVYGWVLYDRELTESELRQVVEWGYNKFYTKTTSLNVIGAGQSNIRGAQETGTPITPVQGDGYEYNHASGVVRELSELVGKERAILGDSREPNILQSTILPKLARELTVNQSKDITFMNTARGGSSVGFGTISWAGSGSTDPIRQQAIDGLERFKSHIGNADLLLWDQGLSDHERLENGGITEAQFKTATENVFTAFRAVYPNLKIGLILNNPFIDSGDGTTELYPAGRAAVNSAFNDIATEQANTFIVADASTFTISNGDLESADGVHWTVQGGDKIAAEIASWIGLNL